MNGCTFQIRKTLKSKAIGSHRLVLLPTFSTQHETLLINQTPTGQVIEIMDGFNGVLDMNMTLRSSA